MNDAELPFDEPVVVPVEDHIDLHSFSPRDVPYVVEAYLEEAAAAGFFEVRIVHGRGKGIQKERVRRVLSQNPRVAGYAEAPAGRGGWGATVVWLTPLPEPKPIKTR